jgi:hypothetical protein
MPAIDREDIETTELGLPFGTAFWPTGDGPGPAAVRCSGFFATGGGVFFDKDVWDEALLRRLAEVDGADWSVEIFFVAFATADLLGRELAGSNGEGNFRAAGIRPRGSVDATDEAVD